MALTVPNEAGINGSPSFTHKKFLIAESSDYSEHPSMLEIVKWVSEHAQGEVVALAD